MRGINTPCPPLFFLPLYHGKRRRASKKGKNPKTQNRRRNHFRRLRFRRIDFYSTLTAEARPAVDRAPLPWYNGGTEYSGREKWKQTD